MTLDPRTIALLGPATATPDQARGYARQRGARRPDQVDAFVAELWRLGERAGYDPAVVFAQFCDETGTGTSSHWETRLNPGGIGVTDGADQMIGFATGTEAARAMLVHLSTYVRGYDPHLWRYIRLDPRYVEPLKLGWGASVRRLADLGDGKWATNPRYAEQIAAHLANIRATTSETPTPGGDRRHRARRVSPDTAETLLPRGIITVPTANWHERTRGQRPVALVYHVTDDLSVTNVRRWFQDPASRASAHFVIDRDGTIYQFVATARAAWTNGDYGDAAGNRFHRTDIPWLVEAIRRCEHEGMNLNDFTIAIEHVGKPGLDFTEAQIARSIALSRYAVTKYGIAPGRHTHLRHADINARDRSYCPGATFPLRRIIDEVTRVTGGGSRVTGGRG